MMDCNDECRKLIVIKDEIDSTNDYLSSICDNEKLEEFTTILSRFQTKGKGQIGNTWESERGKNLTFSTLVYPDSILAHDQFIISMITSTAICDALEKYTDDISIKWPNDIYWKDMKICGMLIENDLMGMYVVRSILGIGININQRHFLSDAPNPISLFQIINHETDLNEILLQIVWNIKDGFQRIKQDESGYASFIYSKYRECLYRKDGEYSFSDKDGEFIASIYNVEMDGHLILKDTHGRLRSYIFKEVKFNIF